jgi:hypothetical protein
MATALKVEGIAGKDRLGPAALTLPAVKAKGAEAAPSPAPEAPPFMT